MCQCGSVSLCVQKWGCPNGGLCQLGNTSMEIRVEYFNGDMCQSGLVTIKMSIHHNLSIWVNDKGACSLSHYTYQSADMSVRVEVQWVTQSLIKSLLSLLLPGCLTSQLQPQTISRTGLLRQFYMLPHRSKSCWPTLPSHQPTVYWHWENQSKNWPYYTRHLAE